MSTPWIGIASDLTEVDVIGIAPTVVPTTPERHFSDTPPARPAARIASADSTPSVDWTQKTEAAKPSPSTLAPAKKPHLRKLLPFLLVGLIGFVLFHANPSYKTSPDSDLSQEDTAFDLAEPDEPPVVVKSSPPAASRPVSKRQTKQPHHKASHPEVPSKPASIDAGKSQENLDTGDLDLQSYRNISGRF